MSRTKAAALTILALLGVSLSACSPSQEPGRFYDEGKRFSIKFPQDWETKKGGMGTVVMAFSPQEGPADGFRENVNVVVEELPRAISLQEYTELSLVNMRKLLTDFQMQESGDTSIGPNSAKWYIYSHRSGSVKATVLQYFLVKDRRAYVISTAAEPGQFSRYKPRFEEIAQTFRVQ